MDRVILSAIGIVCLTEFGALLYLGGEPLAQILRGDLGIELDVAIAMLAIPVLLFIACRVLGAFIPSWRLLPSQWGPPQAYHDQHGAVPYQHHGGHHGPHA